MQINARCCVALNIGAPAYLVGTKCVCLYIFLDVYSERRAVHFHLDFCLILVFSFLRFCVSFFCWFIVCAQFYVYVV